MQRGLPSLPLKRTATLTRTCHNFHRKDIFFAEDMFPLISCKSHMSPFQQHRLKKNEGVTKAMYF